MDRFAQIAATGALSKPEQTHVLNHLHPLPPPEISHHDLPAGRGEKIICPVFDEKQAYEDFLARKAAFRAHYLPFLQNYARTPGSTRTEIPLTDFSYRKETDADRTDFSLPLSGGGEWEKITLPHYVGPEGRWNAFYRTALSLDKKDPEKEYFLHFEAVDYIAEVYLNGRLVCRHEGFFASFDVRLTDHIRTGENILLVVVKNDYTTHGVDLPDTKHFYGKKIYAATHLGYDEPTLGWHHNPAGAGIYGKVAFVTAPVCRITDVFARPDIDAGAVSILTTVRNESTAAKKCRIFYTVEGRNFHGVCTEKTEGRLDPLTVEENYARISFSLPDFRLWTQDEPWLYALTVTLTDENGDLIDERQTHFGMRKFHMDRESKPNKGAYYFNNRRIMLRGTNEMGHLPRAVMEGNYGQLLDDIYAAKAAHINYYRMTQRPVLDDIYTYFDMTGMLCQTDFPLFSSIKCSVVGEALRQVDEMEKHVRNHPCCFLDTFCNELFDPLEAPWHVGEDQHNLLREDAERFFRAAREVVLINNPDRVIKYIEGDYAPIDETDGISDFHFYSFWYISHMLPGGMFRRGYLPKIRPGVMTGCGEYGVDGLDRFDLLKKYCPAAWLPEKDTDPWSPKPIAKGQCYPMHGDFFPEKDCARDWIAASRDYQAKTIKEYVHILRRRADMVESTAVHLLIDAWPCGWTKTLIDVDRIPKPAFYAFAEASIPLRCSLRRDRYAVYAGERIAPELWVFNDYPDGKPVSFRASASLDGEVLATYAGKATASACGADYLGDLAVTLPQNLTGTLTFTVAMDGADGTTYDEIRYDVKRQFTKSRVTPTVYGDAFRQISRLCAGETTDKILFADCAAYEKDRAKIEAAVENGARLVLYLGGDASVFGERIPVTGCTKNFVAVAPTPFTEDIGEEEFQNFYNADADYQDLTARGTFFWEGSEEILYSFIDSPDPRYALHKKHALVAARKKIGKGEVICTTLSALSGCIGHNPVLDGFFKKLIEK